MDTLQDLQGRARKHESAEQYEAALSCYLRILDADAPVGPNLRGRVGTLQLRLGQADEGIRHLAEASDAFAEAGLRNAALALCYRALRADPGRPDFLRRVGRWSAEQGYHEDARRGLLEYAALARRDGDDLGADEALRELLGLYPTDPEVRQRAAEAGIEPEPVAPPAPGPAPGAQGPEHFGLLGNLPEPAASPEPTRFDPPAPAPAEVPLLQGLEPTSAAEAWDPGGAVDEEELPLLGTAEPAADAPPERSPEPDDQLDENDEGGEEDDLPLLGGVAWDPLPEAEGAEAEPDPSLPDPAARGDELRARVLTVPTDLDAQRQLVDHLAEHGTVAELDEALAGAQAAAAADNDFGLAADYAARRAQVRPDDAALLQTWAEYAFRSGDSARLVLAYLGVARRFVAAGQEEPARKVYERVLKLDPDNAEARRALPPPPPATDDFVDLGAMILDEVESTRFRVEAEFPTGDEEHDFNEILAVFRQQISDKIDASDSASHYDLGLAFKEMGLWDDAITQLQRALRAGANPLAALEVLGECFVEKGEYDRGARTLDRAAQLTGATDVDLVGVHYWLGRALEGRGDPDQARDRYDRVVSVDPAFRDAAGRLAALDDGNPSF